MTNKQLEKILVKLRSKNIEHFDNDDKEKLIEVVSNNEIEDLDKNEQQLIKDAFNKLTITDSDFKERLEYITNTSKYIKIIKKGIALIIAAIIIYLIWKIVNKMFNKRQTVYLFTEYSPMMNTYDDSILLPIIN